MGIEVSFLFFEALVFCGYTVHIQAYVTVLPSHEVQTVMSPVEVKYRLWFRKEL